MRQAARSPRTGRPARSSEQLAIAITEYLKTYGTQQVSRLAKLSRRHPETFEAAMAGLTESGTVVTSAGRARLEWQTFDDYSLGRGALDPDALAVRMAEYLAENGPQQEGRLIRVLTSRLIVGREALRRALGSGVLVLDEGPVRGPDGRTRQMRRVRLSGQTLETARRLGTPRPEVDPFAEPDGLAPLWERLDQNSRLSVLIGLPLLPVEVRAVVNSVLDQRVWSRCSESYALSWLLIALAEQLEAHEMLSYEVLHSLL